MTGRWPSRDPLWEIWGDNLYALLLNNPITEVDIDGRGPAGAAIGGAAGADIGAVEGGLIGGAGGTLALPGGGTIAGGTVGAGVGAAVGAAIGAVVGSALEDLGDAIKDYCESRGRAPGKGERSRAGSNPNTDKNKPGALDSGKTKPGGSLPKADKPRPPEVPTIPRGKNK